MSQRDYEREFIYYHHRINDKGQYGCRGRTIRPEDVRFKNDQNIYHDHDGYKFSKIERRDD